MAAAEEATKSAAAGEVATTTVAMETLSMSLSVSISIYLYNNKQYYWLQYPNNRDTKGCDAGPSMVN